MWKEILVTTPTHYEDSERWSLNTHKKLAQLLWEETSDQKPHLHTSMHNNVLQCTYSNYHSIYPDPTLFIRPNWPLAVKIKTKLSHVSVHERVVMWEAQPPFWGIALMRAAWVCVSSSGLGIRYGTLKLTHSPPAAPFQLQCVKNLCWNSKKIIEDL